MEGEKIYPSEEDLKEMNEELKNAVSGYESMSREFSEFAEQTPDLNKRYEEETEAKAPSEDLTAPDKISALLISPGRYPKRISIGRDLFSLQEAVKGPIQAVYPYEDDVALICNEEGKISGLTLNRALRDETGDIYDVIAGDFLLTGLTPDDFGSLSSDLADKYEQLFYYPEEFIDFAGRLTVLTMSGEAVPLNSVGEKEEGRDLPEETVKEANAEYAAGPKKSGFYYETGLGSYGRDPEEEAPERPSFFDEGFSGPEKVR